MLGSLVGSRVLLQESGFGSDSEVESWDGIKSPDGDSGFIFWIVVEIDSKV